METLWVLTKHTFTMYSSIMAETQAGYFALDLPLSDCTFFQDFFSFHKYFSLVSLKELIPTNM